MDNRSKLYREIQAQVNELGNEELSELLSYLQVTIKMREHTASYDPAKDSVVTGEGLTDGATDLADRVEEILYGDEPHSTFTETGADQHAR